MVRTLYEFYPVLGSVNSLLIYSFEVHFKTIVLLILNMPIDGPYITPGHIDMYNTIITFIEQ